MPVSSDPRRLEVALLAVPEASAAVVYGLHEVFACVGTMWETLTGERTQSRRMVPRIVAQTAGPMRTAMGATIVADTAFGDQVRLGAEMVVNNERLLAGENQRFAVGESSLFLVNAREVPLIDTRTKQVEREARLRKAYFSLDHEAGTLWRAWRR